MSLQTVEKGSAFVNGPFHAFPRFLKPFCYAPAMDFRVLRRFLAPAAPSAVLGEGDTDLLIPVFNRPDELRDLLRNLESTVFQHPRLRTIRIGNDGSDPFTRDAIDALVRESKLPIIVSHRTKNLGFGGNCNDLFSRSSGAYCILLNTDITLPPHWLERMLAPFCDPTVALCTPLSTNAANHTIRLLKILKGLN
jgi:cellulose synthase/poly-beta-1,6-N-acetylglucosamine synthase-like glycosyltransferase